jgi:hypothetical protein
MKRRASRRRRAARGLMALAALVVLHELLLRGLAELGLVERMLSLGGVESVLLVLAALFFFALRLFVYFVAPGLALLALLRLFIPARHQRDRAAAETASGVAPSPARD